METRRSRRIPAGLITATLVAAALTWGLYLVDPGAWPGLTGALVISAALVANVGVTTQRRLKIALVRGLQRYVLNPVVRAGHAVGLNPLGLVLLETRGRSTGRPRRVPVGNGRCGDEIWIVAEHGLRANWVRNVLADPRVRVRVRAGARYRWVDGVAEVLPADDPIARQRRICGWRPLRILNAVTVRVLGADLVSVRVRLATDAST